MTKQCQWKPLRKNRDGRMQYRCQVCGTTVRSRSASGQIWGPACEELQAKNAHEAPRGVGDTLASWLRGIGIRSRRGCGCQRRQEMLNRWWPYRRSSPASWPRAGNVLLRFPHGFGDTVQLIVVLRHLARLRPEWQVDVACKPGMGSILAAHCRRAIEDLSCTGDYAARRWLSWPEPERCYADSPSTKAERCLRETFQINPRPDLCGYPLRISDASRQRARAYVASLPSGRSMALVHYQGNSARGNKTLDEQLVLRVCLTLWQRGLQPVVLDWETPPRSRLIDGVQIVSPGAEHALWLGRGVGDGETLAALAAESRLNIGIDSGPGHVFASESVATPAVIIWRRHHPLHYFQPTRHVLHVVPRRHEQWLRGAAAEREAGLRYFHRHYRHHECRGHLRKELPTLVERELTFLMDAQGT